MKRKIFVMFVCLACLGMTLNAQDIITKKNGDEIRAKITEINTDNVKYKKFDNPAGPDYTIAGSDIFMIKYENGDKDLFERNPSTGKILFNHVPAEEDQKQPATTNNRTQTQTPTPVTEPTRPATEPSKPAGQAGNGVFEILNVGGESVELKALKETPLYSVSFAADGRTFKAVMISNTKGEIHFGSGATAMEGSSLLLSNQSGLTLPEGTTVKCGFTNLPAGFVPKSVVVLTDEKAAPMTYDAVSGAWIKPKQISAAKAEVEVYNARNGEHDIVELLENNIIEVEITGKDITGVNLRIRRLVPYPVSVRIPVGSFFVSANPAAQNMVATGEKKARLATDGWQKISMPAACANRPKDIPDSGDSFTVQRSPNQEELATLMPALNKAGAGTTTKQAAVWIITDNADYDDLGILVNSPGNVRAIGALEAARAMKICADAGIDITKKRIWNDRETIASKLPAGELKTWLNKVAAGATGASGQSAPATSTVSTIRFTGGSCSFSELMLRSMLAPTSMKDDEKPFMVRFKYKLNAGISADALSVLKNDGQFVAPDGKTYKAAASVVKADESLYSLVVAVPKDLDVETLKFIYNRQTIALIKK
jgi:hypothetical protein